jgi:ABC-type polysaccharide/polyol phosphate export permease
LNRSTRVRQVHRWASIAFTVGVVVVTAIVASGREEPAEWVYLLPLLPLGLLLLTGLYLFFLPYASRLRRRRPASG